MKFRYLTKFHLQWCAVLSQLGHHHQALKQSRIASDHAMDSILYTEKIADRKLRKSSHQTRLRQQSSSKTSLTRHLDSNNFHYSMEGSQLLGYKTRTQSKIGMRSSSVSSTNSARSIILKDHGKSFTSMDKVHSFNLKVSEISDDGSERSSPGQAF